jgi:subtilisin family serine protease
VPGEIFVKFKENVRQSRQARIERQEGLVKLEDLPLTGAGLYKVEGQSARQAIRDLNHLRDIQYAQPNYYLYPNGYADEPRFNDLWGLHNIGQTVNSSTGIANVDANGKEASNFTQGDPNLAVAVIDDGVDFSHPDLADRAWKNPGESGTGKETNGIDDDGNGYVDDVNGWDFYNKDKTVQDAGDKHGTHVAGTIAASVNGQGVVGVAPNVKIMALKFMGTNAQGQISGKSSDAIKALDYARSKGVKISNNSWSYEGSPSNSLKQAIVSSKLLFVASSGNGGSDGVGDDNDKDPNKTTYPASYDSPNILSVAAIDNKGKLASFSNYGLKTVDISAPGVSILSTTPGGSLQFWNGTSMAAPHATGAAALAASKYPHLLNEPDPARVLKAVVMNSAKRGPQSSPQYHYTKGKTVTGLMLDANAAARYTPPPPP